MNANRIIIILIVIAIAVSFLSACTPPQPPAEKLQAVIGVVNHALDNASDYQNSPYHQTNESKELNQRLDSALGQ